MATQANLSIKRSKRRLAATLSLTALLTAPAAAQRCTSNLEVGCTNSGAVCSPVTIGAGPTGVCTNTPGLPPGEKECECVGLDLTGTWAGNDGAIYYLRQIGTQLWWTGLSVDSPSGVNDLHWGLRFSNVFQGQISNGAVTGDWADVPRGSTLNSGTLTLAVSANQIQRQFETGGFGASVWTRTDHVVPGPNIPPPFNFFGTDIYTVFSLVKKNQNAYRDHSLLDNLKPAKARPVVIFGNILQSRYPPQTFPFKLGDLDRDPMHVNYPANADRCYNAFICLNGNDSPLDGDIDFNIQVDRANLDAQIGFWNGGDWETSHGVNATNFRNKLDYSSELVQKNTLHIESIMYGGTTECGDEGNPAFLLPGWQQAGATGVLFNGRPIAGQMAFTGGTREDSSSTLNSILGRKPQFGDRVRITGILVLDCGHGLLHNCDEDDADTQNQEIHPVYAIDFVQNFRIRQPTALLTGAWSADDAGTYFVRQVGNTVWWLGLSADEGVSFANVFRGTLQNGQISGTWADIPLGQTANSGPLTLVGNQGQASTTLTRVGDGGAFSGSSWQKLYDAGETRLVVAFESVVAIGAPFPPFAEPFELVVGDQRVEARPANPSPVAVSKAKPKLQAELGARIPINVPAGGLVRVAASFAGYRATWTIPESNLKPGVYVQTLKAPKVPRVVARQVNKSKNQVIDRDSRPAKQSAPAASLPHLTIRYRVEAAAAPGKDQPGVPSPGPEVPP